MDDTKVTGVDFNSPSTPVEVGIHETIGPATDLAALGRYLYATGGWAGF